MEIFIPNQRQALNIDQDHSFFDLCGDSISAAEVASLSVQAGFDMDYRSAKIAFSSDTSSTSASFYSGGLHPFRYHQGGWVRVTYWGA